MILQRDKNFIPRPHNNQVNGKDSAADVDHHEETFPFKDIGIPRYAITPRVVLRISRID